MKRISRRGFLRSSAFGSAGLVALPEFIPSRVFAAPSPNQRIQVAQIGCGRMGREDMVGVMSHPLARTVAVCDLDSHRADAGKTRVVDFYLRQGETEVSVSAYHDFHEVLARSDIDAVVVSVPDHWHALVAIQAAQAGKHLYVQKPLAYSIAEAIALRTVVRKKRVILQTGSQQRSEQPFPAFRPASEAVRNGRIGKLRSIHIGVGLDAPKGQPPAPMPVPQNLDYERWLGAAPEQPYMEARVHPQKDFNRPGWITTEDFGLGMITNWGAHHMDIAQWAMGMELSGPRHVNAHAEFMQGDVWTVHSTYHVELNYASGVEVILDDKFENGLRFDGSEGWIFCSRGSGSVTSSDPRSAVSTDPSKGPLRASDAKILSPLGPDSIRWARSPNHYLNWLQAIVARRDPIAPVDEAARSMTACAVSWIGMKLNRPLTWDPSKEVFVNDDAANEMRTRKTRKPEYDFGSLMQAAHS
jgi:predicted dehydrogenase